MSWSKAPSVLVRGSNTFAIKKVVGGRQVVCVKFLHETPISYLFNIAEVEAGEMQETCLERARQLREELDKTGSATPSHPSPPSSPHLSAERLLLLEALDMVSSVGEKINNLCHLSLSHQCKHAVLSEQAGETKEASCTATQIILFYLPSVLPPSPSLYPLLSLLSNTIPIFFLI